MKALSLKQPFAELVASGKKTIEIRKWKTKFRGEFYIHASKGVDEKTMDEFGFTELPSGHVVGKATLVDVKEYSNEKDFKKDHNKHLSSKEYGNIGFILKDIKRVKPFPWKGQLNFFEVEKN